MKSIRVNERNLAILSDLAEAGGLLDTQTILNRRFPEDRTGESCLRRLRLFRSHNILTVVKPTITFGPFPTGRFRMVYGLTDTAVEILEERLGIAVQASVSALNGPNLEHRLGIAKARLIVNDACRLTGFPVPQWISEYDVRPGMIKPGMKFSERYRLCHQYGTPKGNKTCWPDAACLIDLSNDKKTSQLLLLWEYDRSTERLTQIRGKLPGYQLLLEAGDEQMLFPEVHHALTRIFFITPSEERRNNIAAAIRDEAYADRIRLTTVADLTANRFFHAPIWYTTTGEIRSILVATNSSIKY